MDWFKKNFCFVYMVLMIFTMLFLFCSSPRDLSWEMTVGLSVWTICLTLLAWRQQ